MDTYLPYLIMRSTQAKPRCYGARLYVGEGYHESKDFGSMVCEEGLEVRDQTRQLAKSSFGHHLSASEQCVYVLEDGKWRDQHPYFGPSISAAYRKPGTHPEEDEWKSADADSFVKVTDAEGNVWFVANMDDYGTEGNFYLIIPSDIANKRLRQAAVADDVEVTERDGEAEKANAGINRDAAKGQEDKDAPNSQEDKDDTEKLLALFEAYFERNKSDQAQTVADIFKQFLVGSTAGEKFDSFIHTIGDVLCGQEME
ncbi:hypothetical protein ABBQ32_011367 [Trebouxia sp. C0010 RCD-2024]